MTTPPDPTMGNSCTGTICQCWCHTQGYGGDFSQHKCKESTLDPDEKAMSGLSPLVKGIHDPAMEEAVRIVEEHHLLYEPRVDIAVVRKQLGYSIASALHQRDHKISELKNLSRFADQRIERDKSKLAEQEKVIAELKRLHGSNENVTIPRHCDQCSAEYKRGFDEGYENGKVDHLDVRGLDQLESTEEVVKMLAESLKECHSGWPAILSDPLVQEILKKEKP